MRIYGFLLMGCLSLTTLNAVEILDKKPVVDGTQIIEVPDNLNKNLDDLLHEWIVSNSKQDCAFSGTESVFCADTTYINRLYNMPTDFEMVYNSAVKRFIELYAGRRKGQVSYMLALGQYYFPLFEEALSKEGLPLELKYLPIIESALNTTAKSRAGAAGLWQFMPATGKLYGLEINTLVDERYDPLKATNAAVKFLKDMYQVYGDWSLVIAAYNCGPGNVNKAIRRSNGSKDYWEIYPFLPKETRGYVPAFIGATYIMNFYDKHNICPSEITMPLLVDTVKVDKMLHFKQVSEVLDIPIEEIRLLNPQFKKDIIPGGNKPYSLRLPLQNLTAFIDAEDTIFQYKADELFTHRKVKEIVDADAGAGQVHKVRSGENLGAIALKYGTSVSKIKSLNNLRTDKLSIGQTLVIRKASPVIVQKENEPKNIKRSNEEEFVVQDGVLKRRIRNTEQAISYYEVKRGDTWSGVAKKTGASIANIKKWNNIKKDLIAGKSIKIISTKTTYTYEDIERPGKIGVNKQGLLNIMASYVDSITSSPSKNPTLLLSLSDSTNIAESDILAETEILNENTEDIFIEEDGSDVIYIEHQLVYGETLSQIADTYKVKVTDLMKWNNLRDNENLSASSILIKKTLKQIAEDYNSSRKI